MADRSQQQDQRPTPTQPSPRPSVEVLRLRTQMRAADYNPDRPHQVEALACVVTIDTQHFAAVLAGRAPLDWRIPRERLARTLGVSRIGRPAVAA